MVLVVARRCQRRVGDKRPVRAVVDAQMSVAGAVAAVCAVDDGVVGVRRCWLGPIAGGDEDAGDYAGRGRRVDDDHAFGFAGVAPKGDAGVQGPGCCAAEVGEEGEDGGGLGEGGGRRVGSGDEGGVGLVDGDVGGRCEGDEG